MKKTALIIGMLVAGGISTTALADRYNDRDVYRSDHRYEARRDYREGYRDSYRSGYRDGYRNRYYSVPGRGHKYGWDKHHHHGDRYIEHRHHDDDVLVWLGGALIVSEILHQNH